MKTHFCSLLFSNKLLSPRQDFVAEVFGFHVPLSLLSLTRAVVGFFSISLFLISILF